MANLERRAVELFGTTHSWRDTGFLLPDGRQLNLGAWGHASFMEHRAVGMAFGATRLQETSAVDVDMAMLRGWARITLSGMGTLTAQIIRPLTRAQQAALRDAADDRSVHTLYVDVDSAETGLYSLGEPADRLSVSRYLREANRRADPHGRPRRRQWRRQPA